ncbi:MAG: SDR family oxidoreductase [Proteobacteria bacterium]|nr:SDR family oxidoreductase [Pseudomonadota bacterium]
MSLDNKTALVTGSGRGIGRAVALKLAAAGAAVAVNDMDADSAENAAGEIRSRGGQAAAFRADITDLGQVEDMTGAVMDRFGRIDILVNNAGVPGASCLVQDTPPGAWDRTLAVNLTGVFYCCRSVLPIMIGQKSGRIVNIASLAARRISKLGGADYTASKYAVVGFSKHLAFEAAANGVTVNVVCPGATLTEMTREKTTEEFRRQVGEQVPLGRWLTPEEQADAVLFFAGDAAAMITGQVLEVEGGQLLGLAADYREDLARRVENNERNRKRF